jgi:hypothetical protein
MRKLIALLILTLPMIGQGQKQNSNFFFDLHAGGRLGGVHSKSSEGKPGLHVDAGMGYMLSSTWGIKGSIAFDQLNATGSKNDVTLNDNSVLYRANLEAIADLSADRGLKTVKYSCLFHIGFGLATHFHSDYRAAMIDNGVTFADPLIKGNDDMLSIIFGFTPQYKLTNSIYLEADFSLLLLPLSDGVYDKLIDNKKGKSMNAFFNPSLGLSIRL